MSASLSALVLRSGQQTPNSRGIGGGDGQGAWTVVYDGNDLVVRLDVWITRVRARGECRN